MPTRLAQIDRQRAAILSIIGRLAPAAQRARATPTTWSPLEILEHLVLAEQVVLGDLSTVTQRTDEAPTRAEWVRARIVWVVLQFGIRVQADQRMHPSGSGSFESWRAQWEAQHAALRRAVLAMDETQRRRRIFRHPIGGPLDTPQALRLLSAHLATHTRQLVRITR